MSSEQIQRLMDFILRTQADSAIRLEEIQRKLDAASDDIRAAGKDIRALAKSHRQHERSNREHERRVRALEQSERRRNRHGEGVLDVTRILNKLAAAHSKRLDRLEHARPAV